ncbi:Amino acid/polyamine transporter I [Penicillium expansum]|uniref:Amino acid/polyamine transporter I n=1 Tax=Penicillium expansum TaxID=27334 RepID=A0A0A2K1J9_PENEN|nr:Amino acid/polyamine transporter I [Penicillium expansum]KGO58310.1 Amino acid/polyamine transporter I [Penicillium expansum]
MRPESPQPQDRIASFERIHTMEEEHPAKDLLEMEGSPRDQDDMTRMGKIQELKRNFRPLAALSFSAVLQATWEFVLISNTQGLENGGLAGVFWSYMWTFVGFGFIIVSLAEMASMAPTSGGQYHWVSEFSSPRYQKFLSYTTGWMSVLAWQAGAASGSFLTGTIIQGLISLRDPRYEPQNWQGTLFVFAMIAVIYFFNVYAASWMPRIQNILLALHLLCWVVIVAVLFAMAPHNSAQTVFTSFHNGGNWSSMGISLMIGQITAIYGSLSSDATAHMSEEVKDAGFYVPIAIAWGYFGNGILALIIIVGFLLALPSVPDALNDSTGFPFLYVFRQFLSTSGVNGLTAIILIPVIFSNILFNASTARQTYAFARDRGLPFADWISRVDPRRRIPVRAIAISCMISGLLSLINIGSQVAFNAIISLNVAALMYTYAVSISCVIYRKIACPETLPPRRWSLDRKYNLDDKGNVNIEDLRLSSSLCIAISNHEPRRDVDWITPQPYPANLKSNAEAIAAHDLVAGVRYGPNLTQRDSVIPLPNSKVNLSLKYLQENKHKRDIEYDSTYYHSPLERSKIKGKGSFSEKCQALESIHSVYDRVVHDIDRLFTTLSDANGLKSTEEAEERTKIARGAVVEVEEIETKDMKIVESTKPKRSRVRRGKGKRALDVEET